MALVVRRELEGLLTPMVESPEQEIARLRKEKRDWEITCYVLCGLFFLLFLRSR